MKISSSKTETTTASITDQEAATPGVPGEGLFDQLMQLLFASMALPKSEDLTKVDPKKAAAGDTIEETSSQQTPSQTTIQQPLSPTIPLTTTPVENSQDINTLMNRLPLKGDLPLNNDLTSTINLPELDQQPDSELSLQSAVQVIKAATPMQQLEGKPLTNVPEQGTNKPMEANLLQQQATDSQDDTAYGQNYNLPPNFKLDTPSQSKVELAAPQIKMEEKAKTLDQLSKLATQSQKPEREEKHIEKSVSSMTTQTDDLSLNAPTPLPLSQPLTVPVEQQQRVMDAFANIGMLINQKTASSAAEGNQANTTAASATTPFNPQYDLQLETLPPTFNFQLSDKYDARIKIHPPELGNVLAKLKMGKDGAELVLVTENNHVKQIVEANLSQLKQHFQQADIQLTQVEVQMSEAEGKKQQAGQQNREHFYHESSNNDLFGESMLPKEAKVNKDAIVDTYA